MPKRSQRLLIQPQLPSHHSRLLDYDYHILPFVDVEAKCIEHVSDKEEEETEDKGVVTELLCIVPH